MAPKGDFRKAMSTKKINPRRWLVVYIIVALIALAAGFYFFGGANMGR